MQNADQGARPLSLSSLTPQFFFVSFHPFTSLSSVLLASSKSPFVSMDNETYKRLQTQMTVPSFWARKHARDASRNWDNFYRRNQTNFFRDRHWITDSATDGFPCLNETSPSVLVEAGCGVANFAFPLLRSNPNIYIFAFDFSSTAVQLVRQSEQFNKERMHAFVWDFSETPLQRMQPNVTNGLADNHAHFATMIFVLSAIPPTKQQTAVNNLSLLLKPGGKLLFRDYATGDMAQSRFSERNKIDENYYVRQDDTLSYFFSEDRLRELCLNAGLNELYVRRVNRTITNRKEHLQMNRVFLQAEFMKPLGTSQ